MISLLLLGLIGGAGAAAMARKEGAGAAPAPLPGPQSRFQPPRTPNVNTATGQSLRTALQREAAAPLDPKVVPTAPSPVVIAPVAPSPPADRNRPPPAVAVGPSEPDERRPAGRKGFSRLVSRGKGRTPPFVGRGRSQAGRRVGRR